MFKPFYKIQDHRSLFKRLFYWCYSTITNSHTTNIPDYRIYKQYVGGPTKFVFITTLLVLCSVISTAAYQTIYPSTNSMPFTLQATSTMPTKVDHPPTKHGFPTQVVRSNVPEAGLYKKIQTHSIKKQITCLAKNIYFEARSESVKGQLAVGLVTLNRVLHEDFPDNVCDVVWQDKQFSWTHDGLSDEPNSSKHWMFSKKLASFLLTADTFNHIEDVTNNATFYHANYVAPYWGRLYSKTVTVGLHLFYKHDKL